MHLDVHNAATFVSLVCASQFFLEYVLIFTCVSLNSLWSIQWKRNATMSDCFRRVIIWQEVPSTYVPYAMEGQSSLWLSTYEGKCLWNNDHQFNLNEQIEKRNRFNWIVWLHKNLCFIKGRMTGTIDGFNSCVQRISYWEKNSFWEYKTCAERSSIELMSRVLSRSSLISFNQLRVRRSAFGFVRVERLFP
jgi:hypothetical protein